MKIKNVELLSLQKLYGKLMSADFDDYSEGLELANDFVEIENRLKGFDKVKTELLKKFDLEGKEDNDPEVQKANSEFNKLLGIETDIKLKTIKESVYKKSKLNGFDILLINQVNELIKKDNEKKQK